MRTIRRAIYLFAGFVLLACLAWWWLLYSNSGARFVLARAESIEGLQVTHADGSIAGGLDLQDVRFTNDSVDVSVANLFALTKVQLLPLSIHVVEARAQTVRVAIAAQDNGEATGTGGVDTLEGLILPFPLRVEELLAQDIGISRGDFSQVVDRFALSATWHEDIRVHRLAVSTAEFDAEGDAAMQLRHGTGITSRLLATLQPALTRLEQPVSLSVQTDGNLAGADVLATVDSFAEIDGRVRWQGGLDAAAEITIEKLELSNLVRNWPAGFPIDAELHAKLNERELSLRDSVLRIERIDGRVAIDAAMQRDSGSIDSRVRWERLRWPLPDDETRVRSETANLQLSGTIDAWTATGSIAVVADDLPPGVFEIDGHGDRNGARGRIIDSEVLGGQVAGEVAYTWSGEKPWQANLDLANVHLAWLLPDWPAVVSGRLESEGTVDPFAMRATLADIDGQLRGEPLSADGGVNIDGGNVVVNDLRVEHGGSSALLDGTLMLPEGLRFDARVDDLSLYAEAIAGEVAATGTISLADSASFLDATLSSSSMSVGGLAVTGVEATLEASDAGQFLELTGAYHDTPIRLLLKSALANWRKPLDPQFDGRLEAFEIDFGDEHSVALSAPANFSFMTDVFAIDDFCLTDGGAASLCADANWRQNRDYGAQLSLREVPLDVIEHFADTSFRFDQRVSGTFSWQQRFGAGPRGSGRLTVSSGNVFLAEDPTSAVATGDAVLDFEIEEGRLLRGDVLLPFPGRGEVKGNFSVADVRLGVESGVQGNLDIDISTIRVLSRLTSLVDNASGSLQARATLDGTVAEPQVTAEFSLDQASLTYRPIGLELTEVNMGGTMDRDFRFDLSGTFRAGRGSGEIVSRADYGNGDEPGLMFRMRGERLTLVNVPDVFIEADTDIDVALDAETLAINGTVTVPNALIKPTNITVTKINESADVVIVAGELPDQPEETKPQSDLEYEGELNVTLGKSVVVDLDLAKANVTGAVNFNWQGDAMPVATGRYLVDGNIEAFGQVLDISEGSVHFPKVPADKPLIRVMAEREIFGNTQVKRAGVLIDGPIRRPTIEAYTRPHTTEERALALLVTGSDFDYEQGVGALDFGTYIAPRLFVSYGVGVFERENIISARFDLSRGFGIKASSGSKESGVDLNYRFEN